MGEKHAKSDVAAAGVGFFAGIGHEFGDHADYGSFQFEEAALVEEHRHGGGGDWFGQRGQVEESCGGRKGRVQFVGELSEGLKCDQAALVCDGDGGCREGSRGDCVFQN